MVTKERMIAVSIAGARGDETAMTRLFREITDERRVNALRKGLSFMQRQETFSWNDFYVATTTAGQSYKGRLVGRAGSDFMMKVDGEPDPWFAIGDVEDLDSDIETNDSMSIKPRNW